MLVYIAGPLTATDEHSLEQNIAQAADVYFQLVKMKIPAFCPHIGA